MRDLKLLEAGCEPRPGVGAVVPLARRVVRKALRPVLDRLITILNALADRLDAAEARASALEARGDAIVARLNALDRRSELAHIKGDQAHERLTYAESRFDAVEQRLDRAEWNVEVLQTKAEGLTGHVDGVGREFREVVAREAALRDELFGRQDALDEKLQAFLALHWDHVALARRLAVLEDLLAGLPDLSRVPADGDNPTPSIPFPGFEDDSRTRAG